MPFAKDNATRYSFDFTDLELVVTKAASLGKFGRASTDVNIELRGTPPSTRAVSLKLTGQQFDWLLRTISPDTEIMKLSGYCLNCYKPAIADQDGTWIHVGASCGPGEGKFVLGEVEERRSPPKAPSANSAPLDDVKGLIRDLLPKIKPYKMFLPPDIQKAYDKVDVWAQVTDDAMANHG